MKLKTLKDLEIAGHDIVREEAIKWEKRLRFDDEEGVWNIWNQFFNIKRMNWENLKNDRTNYINIRNCWFNDHTFYDISNNWNIVRLEYMESKAREILNA